MRSDWRGVTQRLSPFPQRATPCRQARNRQLSAAQWRGTPERAAGGLAGVGWMDGMGEGFGREMRRADKVRL